MQTVMVRGRVYNYSHTIGRNATGGPGFRHPADLALGSDKTIYVINQGDEFQQCQRVSVITVDQEFIRDFGGAGRGDGQFTWPVAIALDKQENVYVVDEWLNRISIFEKEAPSLASGEPRARVKESLAVLVGWSSTGMTTFT